MQIKRIEEFNLTNRLKKDIGLILKDCFSVYPDNQIYYKQIPSFRYLVHIEKQLVGHLAVHYRMMNVGGLIVPIFGVADLCVTASHRSKNIASSMLSALETLGKKKGIAFIVLIAQDHKLYKKNGFKLVDNTCRWLLINSHQSLGVMHGELERSIMMKSISDHKWQKGILDFMGPIF